MKYIPPLFFLAISGLLIFSFQSCQEDNFSTDSGILLDFSVDTLRFDTVFTELGSATRILKAINTNKRPIEISDIYLENGSSSKFRINVDGYTVDANGNIFGTNDPLPPIPVAGNDSIYIFIEVTIDPDAPLSDSPFVLYENLNFETNGNPQHVVLEAFGQNANYIPNRFNAGGGSTLSCESMTEIWDDPKPYVIYGIFYVEDCELVLPAGTDIYIHGGLARVDTIFYNDGLIAFLEGSKLRVEGTLDNPVTIQGDRLEGAFDDIAGQWAGIRLNPGSLPHEVDHMVLRNSITGFYVDSLASLDMSNSRILNTSGMGIIGYHSEISARNCLIADNGANSAFLYGGTYDFKYCTFSNFGSEASAVAATNAVCQEPGCGNCQENEVNITFENCIISGSRNDEISLSAGCSNLALNVSLQNCVVQVDELLEVFPDFLTSNCVASTCFQYPSGDPLFLDRPNGDYHLDSLSFAQEKAVPLAGIALDLDGETRDGLLPDAGCYESLYE